MRWGEESLSHGFAVPAPFRQGGRWDGGTDCHTSDIGHWFAMTHYKKCGASPGGRTEASAPTEGFPIEFRRGRCPHRPASVTRGTMGGRPQGSPLRKRYKRRNERATARVAPTKAQQEVQWADDRKGRPYESVTRGTMGGRPQGSPLRRVIRSAVG